MSKGLRMTGSVHAVLQALVIDPEAERCGLEIGDAAGLRSGTVHPVLARLERRGWLASRWEDIDPALESRPARRCYRLTAEGASAASAALARASRPKRAVPNPIAGTS